MTRTCSGISFLICLLLTSCAPPAEQPTVVAVDEGGIVVKSRVAIDMGNATPQTSARFLKKLNPFQNFVTSAYAASETVGVTITNSASSYLKLDSTDFKGTLLNISQNSFTNLGRIKVVDLFDNNLRVCGTTAKQKCNQAIIRIYTTGTPKPGIYNADLDYGAPFYGGVPVFPNILPPVGLPLLGLEMANAVTLQTYMVPSSKNVVTFEDFGGSPTQSFAYNFQADFRQAGMGTYATTLVLEYALALLQ